jgi:predicted unusual protein kinase regulating ubiquinone biosynthesis (AarF/ABC1/UbiB family)
MVWIPDDLKYLMLEACAHLYHRDYGLLVEDCQKLGAITAKEDMGPLEADLERIMVRLAVLLAPPPGPL